MKATHVVIADESCYLKKGEKVYILRDRGVICTVQSVNPSYKDGLWRTWSHNLKKINTQMENK